MSINGPQYCFPFLLVMQPNCFRRLHNGRNAIINCNTSTPSLPIVDIVIPYFCCNTPIRLCSIMHVQYYIYFFLLKTVFLEWMLSFRFFFFFTLESLSFLLPTIIFFHIYINDIIFYITDIKTYVQFFKIGRRARIVDFIQNLCRSTFK